jgi:8-oxo-dGDP phosphatase
VTPDAAWFETVASREVYRGRVSVRIDTIRTPDGVDADREIVSPLPAVAVVPITVAGDVLLVRQYRQALGGYLLEIPAGVLDEDGEAPEDAARRELAEEVHHDAGRLEHLITFHTSAGWSDETTTVYLARAVSPSAAPSGFEASAEEADMEVVPLPFDDAVAAARAGELADAKTVVGLLLAADRLRGS